MKRPTRLVLLAAFLAALTSCATTSKLTDPVIATVKDCANETTHVVASGILGDVSSVLICDSGNGAALPACVVSQLGKIAAKAGWVAVECALAEIRQKASDNVMASGDTVENLRARRATAALAWRAGVDGGAAP